MLRKKRQKLLRPLEAWSLKLLFGQDMGSLIPWIEPSGRIALCGFKILISWKKLCRHMWYQIP